MTRQYKRELDRLGTVYNAALSANVSELVSVVETHATCPLTAVGSGGSYSTASFAAFVHEWYTDLVSRPVTPLDVLTNPETQSAILCFSAGGRNRDIAAAFKSACQNETGPVSALVMKQDTPLHAIQRRYEYAQVVAVSDDSFKDGFLAVATLIASSILILRAYEEVFGGALNWPGDLVGFANQTLADRSYEQLAEDVLEVAASSTISVIHSPYTKPAAIDLESRFVEAALGNLHIADLRNFGHGRHHWLAKRGHVTGIVALVSEDCRNLADRTLHLLPTEVPVRKVEFEGPLPFQALSALFAGLFISEAAGRKACIDPGKPGVPKFGRKLYALGPGAPRTTQSTANRRAALRRKASKQDLKNVDSLAQWNDAYDDAIRRFRATPIGGLVFDYDGTLCDQAGRFGPLRPDVGEALRTLVSKRMVIGIATGRGPSAGVRLREVLPSSAWEDVLIGYYNGGIITELGDQRDPIADSDENDPLYQELKYDPAFSRSQIRFNQVQVSIQLDHRIPLDAAIASARSIAERINESVRITTSGHSLDLVRTGKSKCAVAEAMEAKVADPSLGILRLGDKGAWPGNDAEFLDHALGLSVDAASHHMKNCWNLAPAGVRGVQATLYYLSALTYESGFARLTIRPGDKGVRNAS